MALHKSVPSANVRMDCLNDERRRILRYVEGHSAGESFNGKTAQIYNVDELSMPLDHRPPKVISEKGQKTLETCSIQ